MTPRAEHLAILAALLCALGVAIARAVPCEHTQTLVAREIAR